jgi:hypothetical protein
LLNSASKKMEGALRCAGCASRNSAKNSVLKLRGAGTKFQTDAAGCAVQLAVQLAAQAAVILEKRAAK